MGNTTAHKLEVLRDRFKSAESFTIDELYMFYKEFDNTLTMNSVRIRATKMVKSGILKRLGGGLYSFEKKREYFPEVTNKLKTIYKALSKNSPYLNSAFGIHPPLMSLCNTNLSGSIQLSQQKKKQPNRCFIF